MTHERETAITVIARSACITLEEAETALDALLAALPLMNLEIWRENCGAWLVDRWSPSNALKRVPANHPKEGNV
jgi:hypothetical protein